MTQADDNIRIMPSSEDLKKPYSDKEFIEMALDKERKQQNANLIASSREQLPNIYVNGVLIEPTAIASEMQYHPADNKDDAMFAAAQALVINELLKQQVLNDPDLGQSAWDNDEENAISQLIEKHVSIESPDEATCQRYYEKNSDSFVPYPIMQVRHILLASLPEDGNERLAGKKQAYELIKQLQNSDNPQADFIELARKHSACPSKEQGGDLGVVAQGQTVPEFEKALLTLDTGLAPSPIESRYGFHIVEILDKQTYEPLDFEQAYPAIVNQLSQQAFHHGLCDFLYSLVENAKIEGIDMSMNQENIYRG